MTEEIRTQIMPLPGSIRAFTVAKDDYYTIFIRDDLSAEDRRRAYEHELKHIKCGDFDHDHDLDKIEMSAHGLRGD